MYIHVTVCILASLLGVPHVSTLCSLQGGVQITWDSVEQVEDYTTRLRAAAEKLTAENRRLRRCHADLVTRVGGVMSVDLLRQPQRWKDLLMDIRHMMASLTQVSSEAPVHSIAFSIRLY